MVHIDIVRNEWAAGLQRLLGRLELDENNLHLATDDAHVAEVISRPILDHLGGDPIYAIKDPELYFERLPGALHSDYMFASQPHEGEACPFAKTSTIKVTYSDTA